MASLFILIAIVLTVIIAKRFWLQIQENKLRDNPPPRRVIQVSLPRDISDSRIKMARFWRKVASASTGDSKARKIGARQLELVYLVEVPAPGATPELRTLIYADPDKMDSVKRSIKQVFDGVADVVELEVDPMLEVAQQLRSNQKQGVEPEDVVSAN